MTLENIEQIRTNILEQLSKYPEEQVKEIREQIENATDEELEEFVLNSKNNSGGNVQGKCIFCEIASGNIETVKIYEDKDIMAVMDVMPGAKGQIIVFPKKHNQFIQELDDVILNKIFYFIKNISPVLVKVLNVLGISIYIAQGQLAGQNVPHFSVNIIPRYEKDEQNIVFNWKREKKEIPELKKIANEIKENAQEHFAKIQSFGEEKKESKIIDFPKKKEEIIEKNEDIKNTKDTKDTGNTKEIQKKEIPLPILKRKIPN